MPNLGEDPNTGFLELQFVSSKSISCNFKHTLNKMKFTLTINLDMLKLDVCLFDYFMASTFLN